MRTSSLAPCMHSKDPKHQSAKRFLIKCSAIKWLVCLFASWFPLKQNWVFKNITVQGVQKRYFIITGLTGFVSGCP